MVYNGTSSGLNSSLWKPRFNLPTVGSTLWAVERVAFMEDCDIGEIFLNLILSEEVRLFCGLYITTVSTEEE